MWYIHTIIWIWQSILGAAYAHTRQWRSQGPAREPLVRRWDQVCLSKLFMGWFLPIQATVVLCNTRLRYVWGVSNELKGHYLSRGYGLVCRSRFYRCPTRALTTLRAGCCKTRFCRMCHKQEYPPLNGSNGNVLWGHIVSWRAWFRSGYLIVAFRPCQPWKYVCCWKRTASFFVLLLVQEAAIPLCDWTTTIADP